jgi:hypothetical protein
MLLTMSSWYNNVVYQSVISHMLLTMSSWYNNVVFQSVISPMLLTDQLMYQDDMVSNIGLITL